MSIADTYNKDGCMTQFERCQCTLLERIGDLLERYSEKGRPCEWKEYGKPPYITEAGTAIFTGEYVSDRDGECWVLVEKEDGTLVYIEAGHIRFMTDEEWSELQLEDSTT